MDLFKEFLAHIDHNGWQLQKKRLLLAVSGGLDSVVLAHLCKAAGYRFAIAHCNFGLRGADSDADAAFVKDLAETWSVPFFEKRFETKRYADEQKVSIQVAARNLRYSWFADLLQQEWLPDARLTVRDSRLLTAHHRDDSIETLLLNFFKGTGIAGLQGIPAVNGAVLRPLLFASRDALHSWALAQGIQWREDSSNAETKYTRNALRHDVLPLLETIFPQVRQNLAANLDRFAEIAGIYRQTVDLQVAKLLEWKEDEARVPVRKLLKTEPLHSIVFELAKPFGFSAAQTVGLIRLLDAQAGRYMDSATHRAVRYGAWLVFTRLQQTSTSIHVLSKGSDSLLLGEQLLSITEMPGPPAFIPTDPNIALLDERDIQYPLIVRRWKEGDYFYPLGMQKKKKVARYFIDAKVPRLRREQLWVVESHRKIIWVAGLRIDDRFKVTPATTKVLSLQLAPIGPQSAEPGLQNS